MADTLQDQFKKPFLSEQQQALGQQAFETAVQPLRKSFSENLDLTTERLAKRGAFFGGTGQEAFREQVIRPQAERESQIAGGIATSLGQTALEQAFSANEAAKARQQQEKLQGAGFEFQRGESALGRASQEKLQGLGIAAQREEAALGRGFQAEQAGLERGFQQEQLSTQQEFTKEENLAQRDFAREQNQLGRELTVEESDKLKAFQAQEAGRQRDFIGEQATFDRDIQIEQARLGRELSTTESSLLRDFQAEQSRLDRAQQAGLQGAAFENQERLTRLGEEFANDRLQAQQSFQAEQNLLGRTLTQAESKLQREFQTELTDKQLGFQGTEADKSRQLVKQQQVLDLVRAGNIKQEDVEDVLGELVGEGAVLTTDDEADLQRIAAASELSTDQYTAIREAIGTAQGKLIFGEHEEDKTNDDGAQIYIDINGNETTDAVSFRGVKMTLNKKAKETVPNINSFIDDPIKARAFALQMAQIEADLQVDIAREQSKGLFG